MEKTVIKVRKVGKYNPALKQNGYGVRAIISGISDIDDLVDYATRNTTMHRAELRMATELIMDAISVSLKAGNVVDLQGIGKIYPSVKGNWSATGDDLKLTDLTKGVYYRPSDDIKGIIGSASLAWDKTGTGEVVPDEDEEQTGGEQQGGNEEELPETL